MSGKIIVYEKDNFKGRRREFDSDVSKLSDTDFNDKVSSIKVIDSVWVGYEKDRYGGRQYILEEGEYSKSGKWKGSNDQLSSLKKLNMDLGEIPQITLYQHVNYRGKAVSLSKEVRHLGRYRMSDEVSSVKVKSGIWILYEHGDFKGKQYVVTEGRSYRNSRKWKGKNDQLSSARPIKEPFVPTEVLDMTFDIGKGLLTSTPKVLVSFNQRNNTSTDQQATWKDSQSKSTTKTFEWHWKNTTAIGVESEMSVGVPGIASGKITTKIENTFAIGQNRGKKNTQTEEWTFNLPATVKPQTMLSVKVNIQEGKIDVPFTAVLKQGNRVWDEHGIYKGTQSYNLQVDYDETPIEE